MEPIASYYTLPESLPRTVFRVRSWRGHSARRAGTMPARLGFVAVFGLRLRPGNHARSITPWSDPGLPLHKYEPARTFLNSCVAPLGHSITSRRIVNYASTD